VINEISVAAGVRQRGITFELKVICFCPEWVWRFSFDIAPKG